MLKRRRERLSQKEIMDQSGVGSNHDGKADFRGNTEIRRPKNDYSFTMYAPRKKW